MTPRQKFSSQQYMIILLPCLKNVFKSLAMFSSGSVVWIFLIMGNKIFLRHFDCSYLWLLLGSSEGRTICSVQLTIFVMLLLVFCHVIRIKFIEGILFNDIWSKLPLNFASYIFSTFRRYRMSSWTHNYMSITTRIWNVSILEFQNNRPDLEWNYKINHANIEPTELLIFGSKTS